MPMKAEMASKNSDYDPQQVELKWQHYWEERGVYSPDLDNAQKPFYNLMMFPYPSAEGLHVGNMFMQTGSDIYGRFMRMNGFDVFEPMGLDGFGIHSENYALRVGKHPMEQAKISQENFYRQMRMTGSGFDWSRLLETYDPAYYRWTQWLFIQMFKHGLAYRKKAQVNWCPSCKTVLSDEQVIAGECERCGSVVEKRNLEQWFFRITEYARKLLDNLKELDWSERVKIAQRDWIGRSEGALITFSVEETDRQIKVFTTRPETLHGATFLVISPEHEIVAELLELKFKVAKSQIDQVQAYVKQAQMKTDQERTAEGKEKTGVFSGLYVMNPVTNEKIPVWVADYVLGGYGTGAIMAVPAHDQRDFEFAKKYNLSIKHVVMFSSVDKDNPPQKGKESAKRDVIIGIVHNPKTDKYLALKWKQLPWTTFVTGGVEGEEDAIEAARREVAEETGFTDIEFVRVLGGPTEAFYYAQHKGVNRQTKAYSVLFELKSMKKNEVAPEEQRLHELEWLTLDEMQKDKNLRHVEFPLIYDWITSGSDVYTGSGVLVNSGEWDGWQMPDEIDKVFRYIKERDIGERTENYHLRDWLISRQRYWGPPIPMIYCEKCAQEGRSWFTTDEAKSQRKVSDFKFKISNSEAEAAVGWYPVPDDQLPTVLPYIKDFKPLGTGKAPLANHPEFYETTCPMCGGPARRETDVSDTFLDSAWYFFRYTSTDIDTSSFDIERVKKWLPVNIYIGGAEHSVLHLLYARFVTMALHDFGLIGFDEPFTRFFAHGLIIKEGAKMSKSKGNVIVPDEYIAKYGADTLRMYLMFLGPFNQGGDFYDTGIEGMFRFVRRVWILLTKEKKAETKDQKLAAENLFWMHKTIKAVTEDIRELAYNTAIARMMEWYNFLSRNSVVTSEEKEVFLKLLAPFAPHMTEELYHTLLDHSLDESIHQSTWPQYDEKYLVSESVTIVIQVNGKRRADIMIPSSHVSDKVFVQEKAQAKVDKYLKDQTTAKVFYVPGKIINFVLK